VSSKRDPKLWLGEILDSIQEIEDATCQVEAETFVNNHILTNAVSYALLKIAEAVNHLRKTDMTLPPTQPWEDIYNLGNQLRHAYFGIDYNQIWRTVTADLPSLKATCETLMTTLHSQDANPSDTKGPRPPS
jgi:uncharacterized protein with HEPN domain